MEVFVKLSNAAAAAAGSFISPVAVADDSEGGERKKHIKRAIEREGGGG